MFPPQRSTFVAIVLLLAVAGLPAQTSAHAPPLNVYLADHSVASNPDGCEAEAVASAILHPDGSGSLELVSACGHHAAWNMDFAPGRCRESSPDREWSCRNQNITETQSEISVLIVGSDGSLLALVSFNRVIVETVTGNLGTPTGAITHQPDHVANGIDDVVQAVGGHRVMGFGEGAFESNPWLGASCESDDTSAEIVYWETPGRVELTLDGECNDNELYEFPDNGCSYGYSSELGENAIQCGSSQGFNHLAWGDSGFLSMKMLIIDEDVTFVSFEGEALPLIDTRVLKQIQTPTLD